MGTIGRSLVWLAAGVILGIGVLLATHTSNRPEAYVLRSYDVSPDIAVETSNALRNALPGGSGNVSLSPSGQLVVTAPPSIQRGVEQFLKDVAARKPPATPSIRFEVWLVAASPGDPIDSPKLMEVEPALRSVQEAKGRLRFELLEKLAMQVRSGQRGSEIRGQRAELKVSASLRRDSKDQPVIAAQLDLDLQPFGDWSPRLSPPALRAQTELRPGELLVVGQSNLDDKSTPDRELYYIVRATL